MSQHRTARSTRTGILAAATAGALLLAGCSAGGDGGDSGEGDGDGDVEFSLAYAVSNTADVPYETLAQQYMEENPNVTITLNATPGESYPQTLQTQLQAGNASDVFQTAPGTGQQSSIVTLAEAGLLEPLDDAATALIPAGNESQFQVDGETYGQALSISFLGVVLNKTAADDAGIEYPDDWQGVLDACADAASQDKSLFVVAGAAPPNAGALGMVAAATRVFAEDPDWNQQRIDGDVTFSDTEGWHEALEAVVELKDEGCFQPGVEGAGFDAITNGVGQGTSLALFGPSGATADLEAGTGQEFLVEALPPAEGGTEFGYVSSNYALSVATTAKEKEAIQEFLDWMAEPEQSAAFAEGSGSLPVTGYDDYDFESSAYAPVADLIKDGSFVALPNSQWSNATVYDALASGVQGLLTGQKTVDQVLAEMDAAWGE